MLPPDCLVSKGTLRYFVKSYESWLFALGNPELRPDALKGKPFTPEEHRKMLLEAEALQRVLLFLLREKELAFAHQFLAIPKDIQLQPLSVQDTTPPDFERWLAGSGDAADVAAQPPAVGDETPSLSSFAQRGDNDSGLSSKDFLAVAAKSEAASGDAESQADDVFDAAPPNPMPPASRCCFLTFTDDNQPPCRIQLRIYLLDKPDKDGPPRLLFKLGKVKDEEHLVPALNHVFTIEVTEEIEKMILSGEAFNFTNPLHCEHLLWYLRYYKFPYLCVSPPRCTQRECADSPLSRAAWGTASSFPAARRATAFLRLPRVDLMRCTSAFAMRPTGTMLRW